MLKDHKICQLATLSFLATVIEIGCSVMMGGPDAEPESETDPNAPEKEAKVDCYFTESLFWKPAHLPN